MFKGSCGRHKCYKNNGAQVLLSVPFIYEHLGGLYFHLYLLPAFGFSVKAGDEHLVFGFHEHEGVVAGTAVFV